MIKSAKKKFLDLLTSFGRTPMAKGSGQKYVRYDKLDDPTLLKAWQK